MRLIDQVISEIMKSSKIKEAINALFEAYGNSVLRTSNSKLEEEKINLCLRIADIFSKVPDDSNKSEHYHSIAQEIIYMLHYLIPNNADIDFISDSVLSSLYNYPVREQMELNDEERKYGLIRLIGEKVKMSSLEIPGEKGKFFLLPQKIAYEGFENKSFSYSGPTSMGKTFLMTTFIKQRINDGHNENFAIIVPTKALINELKGEVIRKFRDEIINKNYRVISSANDLQLETEHRFILILTPERLMYFLIKYKEILLDYVFFDEAHKISEKDPRSSFYYKDISLLSKNSDKTHIIFSSPNIPNPNIYSNLYGQNESKSFRSQFSPVSQFKFSVRQNSNSILIYNDFTNEDINLPFQITNNKNSLIDYIYRLTQENQQSIIYVNNVDYASKLAQEMYDKYGNLLKITQRQAEKLDELASDIEKGITEKFSLCHLIKKGIAFHTGYLPPTLRARLEQLYKDGCIRFLFCTSTLIEGVNLPADNLFVTTSKNGRAYMTPTEFRNLTGRVGRLGIKSFGNVFLISDDENHSNKMEELVKAEVTNQKLSLDSVLTPKNSKEIVYSLSRGRLPYSDSTEKDKLLVQKLSLIFAKDISERINTYFSKKMEKRLIEKGKATSNELIQYAKSIQQEDDINVNFIQEKRLYKAIYEDKLQYPEISTVNYDQILGFLTKLYEVFQWEIFEGKDIGNKNSLRHYAVLLQKWIMGNGLKKIVEDNIDFHDKKRFECPMYINHKKEIYSGKSYQIDSIISNTLKEIEGIILFKLSNYFLKFSNVYKEFTNQKRFANDWYEFIEFGTHEPVIIFLQKIGFSRETSLYIRQNEVSYIQIEGNKIYLKHNILKSTNKDIQKELKDLDSNIREYILD